jgi:hypothetical protein
MDLVPASEEDNTIIHTTLVTSVQILMFCQAVESVGHVIVECVQYANSVLL